MNINSVYFQKSPNRNYHKKHKTTHHHFVDKHNTM